MSEGASAPGLSGRQPRALRRMERKMRSQAVGEIVNVPLQLWLWFSVVGLPLSVTNAAGYMAFAVLLVQGSAYWSLKYHQLRNGLSRPVAISQFRWVRSSNLLLLFAVLVFTGASVAEAPGAGTVPGLCFALFAVLEYVNYFHRQLMPTSRVELVALLVKGPRESALARDLRRAV